MKFNLFKIEYNWYEGDHEETILGKNVEGVEFEKDLVEAKDFANKLIGTGVKNGDYLGKGYSTECLPEYYKQIKWFLIEKKGYIECYSDEGIIYHVDDSDKGKVILVRKYEEKTKISDL